MNWIQTFSGRHFDVFSPKIEDINIFDIAHALSNSCRFGGHTSSFYSVAQHSVEAVKFARENLTQSTIDLKAILLHDASEAFLVDMPRPIKARFSNFCEIESFLNKLIFKAFSIVDFNEDIVRYVDDALLVAEARRFLGVDPLVEWGYIGFPDVTLELEPLSPNEAESEFLRFWHLLFTP